MPDKGSRRAASISVLTQQTALAWRARRDFKTAGTLLIQELPAHVLSGLEADFISKSHRKKQSVRRRRPGFLRIDVDFLS
jgi:hypothetical protein